ncbi:MAG TPA: hypothetical protein PLL45_16935 [Thermoflexales bacterium]|nr:hypothetical protein [Thermoflexales bacterium]
MNLVRHASFATRHRFPGLWIRLALLLLVFCLGSWALDARALWGDEAFSVWVSKAPAGALALGLDTNPPGYFLTVKLTRWLFGESVFALRFPALCFALVFTALAARLGREMAPPGRLKGESALVAAWVGLAPLTLYFAQEARMYTLACALSAGAMWMTVRLMSAPTRRVGLVWTAYAVLAIGSMYTHLYAAALVGVCALGLVVACARDRRRLASWALAHAAIAAVFGAWFFGRQTAQLSKSVVDRPSLFPALPDILANAGRGLNGLLFGVRADLSWQPVALALAGLIAIGALAWLRRRPRRMPALALGWLAAAVAIACATSGLVPEFHPRYFMFALLPIALCAAIATRHIPARPVWLAGAIAALVLAPITVIGNAPIFDPTWTKSRYDQALASIRATAQPGDGAILQNSDQIFQYEYYGPLPMDTLHVQNAWSPAEIDRAFEAFAAGKRRIWLLNYGSDAVSAQRPRIEQRLAQTSARARIEGYQDATLSLYQLLGAVDAPVEARNARWTDGMTLAGLRWRARNAAPGGGLTLDMIWRAEARPSADYTLFLHLRRATDDARMAGDDAPPVAGTRPTTTWAPGEVITDTRALALPATLPPGKYRLVVGWYRYPSFERPTLAGSAETEVILETIEVP